MIEPQIAKTEGFRTSYEVSGIVGAGKCKGYIIWQGKLLTTKPAELAHTLFPSALKIAAVSSFPEPTRL